MCKRRGMPFEWAFVDRRLPGRARPARHHRHEPTSGLRTERRDYRPASMRPATASSSRTWSRGRRRATRRCCSSTRAKASASSRAGTAFSSRFSASSRSPSSSTRWTSSASTGRFADTRGEMRALSRKPRASRRSMWSRSRRATATTSPRQPPRMRWYRGPTLIGGPRGASAPAPRSVDLPLQLARAGHLQVRPAAHHRRAHRERPPRCRRHAPLLPLQQDRQGAVDRGVEQRRRRPARSQAGQSVGITLDEPLFIERGEIDQPCGEAAGRDQRVPRAPLLARPHPAQRGRALHAQAPHRGGARRGAGDRAGDRPLRPLGGEGGGGRAPRRRRGRLAQRARCWRSILSARTRAPDASC